MPVPLVILLPKGPFSSIMSMLSFEPSKGISVSCTNESFGTGQTLLHAEWVRLKIEMNVICSLRRDSLHLCLAEKVAQEWMPKFDTLNLANLLKLRCDTNEDDLMREIWLALLNSPILLKYPSADELISAVRIRRNIVRNATLTCLNFHTTAVERPSDCWRYSKETGFVLIPGSPLIVSLRKACQPESDGKLYSFSCYRATEYVILLSIAEEARESHPELLHKLQSQWEKEALTADDFQDAFLNELGSLQQPLPVHYYVPGDRVWFRNPDAHSMEVTGYEGSWVVYLGSGRFSNFWKLGQPYTALTKCIEIYHWRDATFTDAQGELQMDETKVEQLVAQTLASKTTCDKIYQRMLRIRDPVEVFAEGGCMDATRETAKFVRKPHCDILKVPNEPLT